MYKNYNDVTESPRNALIPMVVEQTAKGERSYDIYSRLLKRAGDLPDRSGRGSHGEPGGGPTAVPGVRKTRIGTSASTSTRRVAPSRPVCPSMTPCSSSSRM